MLRTLPTLYLLIAFLATAYGQSFQWLSTDKKDFKEVIKASEDYLIQNVPHAKSPLKQYKRWTWHYENRLNAKGELFNFNAANRKAYLKMAREDGHDRSTHGYWISEGPDDYITTTGWNGGNGRVNCMAFHPNNPNTIFIGTPFGGLWKTIDGGDSWAPVADGLCLIGITSIAFEGTSGDVIYIMTGQGNGEFLPSIGVLKSTDGGANWFETGLTWGPDEAVYGYDIKVSPVFPHVAFTSTSVGLFRTLDAGVTWENMHPFRTFDVEFRPGSDSTIFIGTNHGGYRSDNLGVTIINTGLNVTTPGQAIWRVNFEVPDLGENPLQNTDTVYALYGNWRRSNGPIQLPGFFGLYRSMNGGQNFTLLSNSPNVLGNSLNGSDTRNQAARDLAIAMNPMDNDQVFTGGINVWNYDDNATTSWQILSHWNEDTAATIGYTHADISQMKFNNGILYCASDGGFFTSADLGQTWVNKSQGLTIMQSYSFDVENFSGSGTRVTTGTQDNGSNHWNLSGQQAIHSNGGDGMATLLDPTNELRFYQCSQGQVYRTTDAGLSFDVISPDTIEYWFNDMIMDPIAPSRIYISGMGKVFRTDDFGTTWTDFFIAGLNGSKRVSSLAQNGINQNILYLSNGEQLFRTSNATASPPAFPSWTNLNLPAGLDLDATPVTDVIVDPDDVNRIWICLGGYTDGEKVYFTSQGNQSTPAWTNVSGNLPDIPSHEMIYEPGSNNGIYVATEIGVFYRNDDLGDWIYFSNGLPSCAVYDLDIENGQLYAGTFGRGIWRTALYSTCVFELTLTLANDPSGSSTGTQFHQASTRINSTQVIAGGAGTQVVYQAGVEILLTAGFEANTFSEFSAKIGACGVLAE